MFCKKISYEDFNGVKREDECCFHLTKAEVIDWVTQNGDYTLEDVLKKMINKNRGRDIIDAIREIIYRSYGEKSLDGKRFIKTEEVKREFMESEAYSVLFMELVTSAEKAAEFMTKIIPKDMAEEVDKLMKEDPAKLVEFSKKAEN